MNTDDLLTVNHVCELLGVTSNTLKTWSDLPRNKPRHLPVQYDTFDNRAVLRYKWADLRAFLSRRENEKYQARFTAKTREQTFDHLVARLEDYQYTVALTQLYLASTTNKDTYHAPSS